jgi:hypothetical protein
MNKTHLLLIGILLLSGCATTQSTRAPEAPVFEGVKAEKDVLCRGVEMAKCGDKLLEIFHARLGLAYGGANFDLVKLKCNSNPPGCTPQLVEQWTRESHEQNVRQARLQQTSEAFKRASETLAPKPAPVTTCTSTANGPFLNTTCK